MAIINIDRELKKYIEANIFPIYTKNDLGHDFKHIEYVIQRSFKFARMVPGINYSMVYVVAAYHDIGHFIDAKNHEKISSEILFYDTNLKRWFTEEEIRIMAQAVYDHRASLDGEPKNIYGKIVSSADRNTSIDLSFQRAYAYRMKHQLNLSLEKIIEDSRMHFISKFGQDGYAREKMYFPDEEYECFLKDMNALTSDPDAFQKRFLRINHLDKQSLIR